ncbi:family 20 glycosylhydrolase [Vibrio nigripulchritudo]|uniref:family 20 glycosylhydrolase n=1 Tax=Vibrio nigripulchritudo TaxID=28173 RepID=UPI002492C54B|nr:family 20 glycosylhydrolase [Vibrio nigripulchritudo]BDU38459.1 N-acetyl-beta-hexosaminidase [Vibrio nigripulchritudo]BDU44181.1 N-acetyl-beta-hexosaminidase [Vibrio nigripulchritudo]
MADKCPSLFPAPKSLTFEQGELFIPGLSKGMIPKVMGERISSPMVEYQMCSDFSDQAFGIQITRQLVLIQYKDESGILYAHHLINQLVDQCASSLPFLTLFDQPDFPQRGIILDVSRDKIPTMDTLFELIDFWSSLRINQLQFYTEHTFAYQQHHTVWQDYDPLTPQQIRALDYYCKTKGIELIPNQATFGHMEKWLCHPEYTYLAEQTSGFYDQRGDFRPESFGLNPVSPDVPGFIADLLDELLPNFSSKTLNINFDETMDLGVDGSKAECESLGQGQVYLNYLNKVLELARQRGMYCQIFSDMLFRYPEILPHLPKELELLNWGYEEDHPYDEEHARLAEFGYPFQVVVSTNTFASVAGRWKSAQVHMRRAAISALKYGGQGYQISEWGDMGHAQQFSFSLPAYVFGAAMAWGEAQHQDIPMSKILGAFWGKEYQSLTGALLEVQDAYLDSGVTTPNCAFYGPFVFDQKSRRHIRRAQLEDTEKMQQSIMSLTEMERKLGGERESTLKSELLWTLKTMKLATEIAIGYAQNQCREVESFPNSLKRKLVRMVADIESEYAILWQEKFRLGGCKQSMARLQYLRQLLSQ